MSSYRAIAQISREETGFFGVFSLWQSWLVKTRFRGSSALEEIGVFGTIAFIVRSNNL
ncbi:MAG: hypothetical protein ACRC62_10565 [Microcoleus sp.]